MGAANDNPFNPNLSMLCDYYELTMGNAYFANGMHNQTTYFDLYFRELPDGGGYAIAAGLEQAVEYLSNLSFTPEDIEFLRGKGQFSEGFLEYLRNFRFCCDVWAVPEGTPVFPNEPLVTVRGPAVQTHLLETMLLLTINHQTLVATKASRIVRAAAGRAVMEFGSRRAQGYAGAVLGARAAYIAGCIGTACTITDRLYGVPALGTMSHAWVQMFDSELEAFRAYAREYPSATILLVDTYNVLKSGLPNAIRIFNEEVVPRGFRPAGIRIDSGDIAYLSKQARKILDEAGFPDCKITASNSLDEYIIRDTILQGAQIDSFGVGERLITSKNDPVLGGVVLVVAAQVVFMVLACRFVIFRLLGGNYDAAVMCAGLCGHGLGATPSAIVNMTAVKDKYGMSRKAFMIVPIVGAFLVDVIYQPQTIAFIKFFVMPK